MHRVKKSGEFTFISSPVQYMGMLITIYHGEAPIYSFYVNSITSFCGGLIMTTGTIPSIGGPVISSSDRQTRIEELFQTTKPKSFKKKPQINTIIH